MSIENAFRRASRLLHRSLEQSNPDSLVTNADIESLARTIAFVTSIARVTYEAPTGVFHADPIPYTVAAATNLAEQVRLQLGIGDIDPVFDLASRLSDQLATLVFPIHCTSISSACAIFERTLFLFVSQRLGFEQLSECARAFGTAVALSARSRFEEIAFIDTLPRTTRGGGPRSYFAANFSGQLLIPTRGLGVSLRKVREILKVTKPEIGDIEMLYVARIFGVSFAEIVRRCERAGLLPPGGARTLEKFLLEQFGSPEQRANQLGLPVRPSLQIPTVPHVLLPVLIQQMDAGIVSRADSAFALGTTEETLTSLLDQKEHLSERFWQ